VVARAAYCLMCSAALMIVGFVIYTARYIRAHRFPH
jgi:hypothetical protein